MTLLWVPLSSTIIFYLTYVALSTPLTSDMKIKIENKSILYSWYHKECHSDITLRKDSFVPNHVKDNFIRNRKQNIRKRCSNEKLEKEKLNEFNNILVKNGYKYSDFCDRRSQRTKLKNTVNVNDNKKKCIFKIPFINERCNRKISKTIKNMTCLYN